MQLCDFASVFLSSLKQRRSEEQWAYLIKLCANPEEDNAQIYDIMYSVLFQCIVKSEILETSCISEMLVDI